MIYTEEQWRLIKQASPHYETARHEYIRNAPRWLTEQIISVYEAATGKTVMHKDLSCAVCVLNIYKQIGKTYFQDKLERENFDDLEEKNKIESKDNDTRSETKKRKFLFFKKRNAKSKTGNKKKKE